MANHKSIKLGPWFWRDCGAPNGLLLGCPNPLRRHHIHSYWQDQFALVLSESLTAAAAGGNAESAVWLWLGRTGELLVEEGVVPRLGGV